MTKSIIKNNSRISNFDGKKSMFKIKSTFTQEEIKKIK